MHQLLGDKIFKTNRNYDQSVKPFLCSNNSIHIQIPIHNVQCFLSKVSLHINEWGWVPSTHEAHSLSREHVRSRLGLGQKYEIKFHKFCFQLGKVLIPSELFSSCYWYSHLDAVGCTQNNNDTYVFPNCLNLGTLCFEHRWCHSAEGWQLKTARMRHFRRQWRTTVIYKTK